MPTKYLNYYFGKDKNEGSRDIALDSYIEAVAVAKAVASENMTEAIALEHKVMMVLSMGMKHDIIALTKSCEKVIKSEPIVLDSSFFNKMTET